MKKKAILALLVILVGVISCRKDILDDQPPIPGSGDAQKVVFDLDSVPYNTLSHYNFFQGSLADLEPSEGVLPFEPITPLFSDYAHKKRFVWMPEGVSASYESDGTVLSFPDGAVLIKNFYYDHVQPDNTRQIIETRLLIRKNGQWIFANYVWNAEQTEATLDLGGSYTSLIYENDHDEMKCITYRIPSEAECHTCHKLADQNIPIGVKPQNINSTIYYNDGPMNQLAKWEEAGYLTPGFPTNINPVVDWTDATESLNDRVRAYVDMNCSHCHSEGRHCDYRPMRFAWSESVDPVNLGVCVVPEDIIEPSQTHIVAAGNPARSMLYYRVNSNDEAVRMPLFGRNTIHTEAVELMHDWIDSLSPPCQ
jgi:uncharacterized repeat protein (TIGR03806 family)